ncbi:NET1-associated nuclear protein 1 [Coemansia sp. RSA 2598]|nr:NET1-associated nuclear protein 1 [Coemansia sp. RSA 2598]
MAAVPDKKSSKKKAKAGVADLKSSLKGKSGDGKKSGEKGSGSKKVRINAAKDTPSSGPGTSSGKKEKTRPPKLDLTNPSQIDSEDDMASYPMTPMTPMVESTITMQDTEMYREIELKLVSGGLLTNDPVVFSSDSTLFYLAKDNAVAVYNVQNAEMVQNFSIQRDGHGYQPTAVHAIVAGEGRRLYTFSADSRARLWDADSGSLIKTWAMRESAVHAVADPAKPGSFYCTMRRGPKAAAKQNNDKVKYVVAHISLGGVDADADANADAMESSTSDDDKGEESNDVEVRELLRLTGALGLVVRPGGGWIGAYSKFRVHLACIKPNGKTVQHKWHMAERVSTLAFHPTEPILAVGDWRGRIMNWFCIDDDEPASEDRSVLQKPMHWHAHKVNTVVFAADGQLMLSGGDEGVLVLWQLATDTKSFLPRLGSDIMGIAISPDQMLYALTLRDNTVRVFSALDRSLVSMLQGLKFAERGAAVGINMRGSPERIRLARKLESDAFTTGLIVHPTSHALVLNGDPGHLQVFNHTTDRHMASIEIVSFNRVGGSTATDLQNPHVDIVQYSSDGTWMATVDSRGSDSAYGPSATVETYLKFWRLDTRDQKYKLVTRVDSPHARGVCALAFQPAPRRAQGRGDGLLCVSTGRDGAFRVWELESREGAGGAETHYIWICRNTVRFRGLQPRSAAFSADGSTLAVAFGGCVTLWDAATCTAPVCALVASAATPSLTGVAFIGGSNFLAAWSRNRLDVWNMLTGSVWWTLAMPLQSVFVHPKAALLAVAAYQIPDSTVASIMVLEPMSPVPLVTLRHTGGVESVVLVPAESSGKSGLSHPSTESGMVRPDPLQNNSLVVLTPTGLLNVYAAEADNEAFAKAMKDVHATAVTLGAMPMKSTAFNNIFGASSDSSSKSARQTIELDASGDARVRQAMRLVKSAVQSAYVNAPNHVLPTVSALYDQFVKAQLLPRSQANDIRPEQTEDSGDRMDVDENKGQGKGEPMDEDAPASVDTPKSSSDAITKFSSTFSKSLRSGYNTRA